MTGTPCALCPNEITGLHWHMTWDARVVCVDCAKTPAGRKALAERAPTETSR